MTDNTPPSSILTSDNIELVMRMAAKLRMNSLILGEDPEIIELLNEVAYKFGGNALALQLSGVSLPDICYRSLINLEVRYPGSIINMLYKMIHRLSLLSLNHNKKISVKDAVSIKSINCTARKGNVAVYQILLESLLPIPMDGISALCSKVLKVDHLPDNHVFMKDLEKFAPEVIRSE